MIEHASTKLELVITGCPCSGTKYTAHLLQGNGYIALHESLDYKRQEALWWSPGTTYPEIEVSYTMNQWLDVHPCKALPVVWLIREPLKVISSWLAKGLHATGEWNPEHKIADMYHRNQRTKNHPHLALVHRVEEEIDPLLKVVASCVQPVSVKSTKPELSNLNRLLPSMKTNTHNPGTVNLTKDIILKYPYGREFLKDYEDYYE
jgi:hypothetical protein